MVEGGDDALLGLDARSELLSHLVRGRYRYEAEGRVRAEAAGFPMTGRTLVGLAIEAPGVPPEEIRSVVARSAAAARLDLLMGLDCTGLLSLAPGRDPLEVLCTWSERLRRELGAAVIGLGEPVTALSTIRGSLLDAASAVRAETAAGGRRPVVRLIDVRVRGLLAQLVRDPRLQGFVERELGPLLDSDHATELDALRAYLAEGRNKSAAAQAVRVSRPAFYARLRRAAAMLDADLDDPETCLSLQLALLGQEIAATDQPVARVGPANCGDALARLSELESVDSLRIAARY